MWINDKMNGEGIYFMRKTGDKYDGNWQDGEFTGFGIIHFKTGEYCQGSWLKGKLHGFGACYNDEGDLVKDGIWEHGKFLK